MTSALGVRGAEDEPQEARHAHEPRISLVPFHCADTSSRATFCSMDAATITIRAEPAEEAASLELVRRYLTELRKRLGVHACAGDVEVEAVDYRPPAGAFLVVRHADVPVGCGAIRTIGGEIGELKRMWVAPAVRGHGVGCRLLMALENEARRLGYRTVRLDTRRELSEAMALYLRAGYREVPAYNDNCDADVWLEKLL